MNVVVVESPAKAKTINKYLGPNYTVVASYGHVRDLPAKDGSVLPDADFAMQWEVDERSKKHLKAIADALRGADHLYLATDPDREGEAISWHVREVLEQQKALVGVNVQRVAFNEITQRAIEDAFANPRQLDRELISAYLARRALDYLVGFTLSPVLWRKLPGSRSAGRVQSVALRLICERETEIEQFTSRAYWTIKALFRNARGDEVTAQLTTLDGRKLDKFDLACQEDADRAVGEIQARQYAVASVEQKQVKRNPAPPFITSTLQQEASRKLGFTATQTMRAAQQLYEGVNIGGETVGLITYMRTDGVNMAMEAVTACRKLIGEEFGAAYVPEKPRLYKAKVKNAQEAHEAIRPTDVSRHPGDVERYLDASQQKLYTLIWKRTLASQMESAVLDQVAIDIASPDGQVVFRATGSVVKFDGFLKVYREGRDEPESGDAAPDPAEPAETLLPRLETGEDVNCRSIEPEEHFTQPPPRFTEASLVKKLEELGIGRPSTYASIISVLQERNYVLLEQRRFRPEDRGRLVTAFLTSFFERYFAYGFTAEMEEKLDHVSGGDIDWRSVLDAFWRDFSAAVEETKDLRVKEVLDALDERLGPHFFRPGDNGADPRKCPACADGRLSLKLGKFGAFIGCSNYPECRHTRPLVPLKGDEADGNGQPDVNGKVLGTDPATQLPVVVKRGPYGHYLQLGETVTGGRGENKKPVRASIPSQYDPDSIDLTRALALLSLPREIGLHPETGGMITAGIGRFGPYVRLGDTYVSVRGDDDILELGINRAVDLLSRATQKKTASRLLGAHPEDGKPVTLKSGRYGPYVEHNKTRATLPKNTEAEQVSLEQAVSLIAAKSGQAPAKAKPKGRKSGQAKSSARNRT